MGFCEKWQNLIHGCLCNEDFGVLVYGVPHGYFPAGFNRLSLDPLAKDSISTFCVPDQMSGILRGSSNIKEVLKPHVCTQLQNLFCT